MIFHSYVSSPEGICVYPSQRCLASSQCLLAARIRGFDTRTADATNGIDPENIPPSWGIASVMLRQMEVEDVRVHWIPYIYIHIYIYRYRYLTPCFVDDPILLLLLLMMITITITITTTTTTTILIIIIIIIIII